MEQTRHSAELEVIARGGMEDAALGSVRRWLG